MCSWSTLLFVLRWAMRFLLCFVLPGLCSCFVLFCLSFVGLGSWGQKAAPGQSPEAPMLSRHFSTWEGGWSFFVFVCFLSLPLVCPLWCPWFRSESMGTPLWHPLPLPSSDFTVSEVLGEGGCAMDELHAAHLNGFTLCMWTSVAGPWPFSDQLVGSGVSEFLQRGLRFLWCLSEGKCKMRLPQLLLWTNSLNYLGYLALEAQVKHPVGLI